MKLLISYELLLNGCSTLIDTDWKPVEDKIFNCKKANQADIEDLLYKWLELQRYMKALNKDIYSDNFDDYQDMPRISLDLFLENLFNDLQNDPSVQQDLSVLGLDLDTRLSQRIKKTATEWYNYESAQDVIPII